MKANVTKENPGEMYARWYFEELMKEGYVEFIDREPEKILVLDKYTHKKEKHYKSKNNVIEDYTLLNNVVYTYDFRVGWTKKAYYLFTEVFNKEAPFKFGKPPFISHYIKMGEELKTVSYIDVKAHNVAARFSGGMASAFTFPFVQKFLMATRGLYINKMIPANAGKHGINSCMFAKTFVPNRFLFTDTGQQLRAIKIKKTTLNNFVSQKQSTINELLKQQEIKNPKKQGDLFQ